MGWSRDDSCLVSEVYLFRWDQRIHVVLVYSCAMGFKVTVPGTQRRIPSDGSLNVPRYRAKEDIREIST